MSRPTSYREQAGCDDCKDCFVVVFAYRFDELPRKKESKQ